MTQGTKLRLFYGAVFALLGNSAAFAQAVPGLDALRVATGLTQPVFVTVPPGDYNRLFIVELTGAIKILNLQTGVISTFLSITVGTTGEQGLLGLAFDPSYATNGRFYVHYVANIGQGETRIVQYQVSANPDLADTTPATIKTLLTLAQPQTNHNGGWIGFSPRPNDDHNLYIALGDGGNGDDAGTGHHEPGGNAQWNQTLLGKMLRIHVDPASGTYTIPADNPFFGQAAPIKQEIWLLGLRNPFRDGFDRGTGRLFIGDVGQSSREEIDVQQPSNPGGGENYGWRDREGLIQNPTYATATPTPTPVPARIDPVMDFTRSVATTIIGGYVYRGKQIPALLGTYVFGDDGVKKIYTFNYNGGAFASNFQDITGQLFPTAVGGFLLGAPVAFGEDSNGEIYICDINNGAVFRIVPATPNVKITLITKAPGGLATVQGLGVPFTTVTLQSTDSLVQPFSFLSPASVSGDGTFQYIDNTPPASRFYRVVYP